MYHTLQFTEDYKGKREIARNQRLERIRIKTGSQVRAEVKPYVVEGADGPVEVADLFFEDGTATRTVPFAYFAFVS
jgi:hypothetical protein